MDKNYFRTRDLSISSYLISTGKVNLVGTEKTGKEIIFLFTPLSVAKELTNLYWQDKAPPIQPRQLFQSLRSLKDLLFSNI